MRRHAQRSRLIGRALKRLGLLLGALILAVVGPGAGPTLAADEVDPFELLAGIRQSTLDPSGAVTLEEVRLDLDRATLIFERGTLVPARAIGGRSVEAVFTGKARFLALPPDAIEAGQLQLFTGQPALDAELREMVLVLTEPGIERLLGRGEPVRLDPDQVAESVAVFEEWISGTARRGTGIESSLFKSLVGDVAFSRYVAVWCRSELHGDFVYQLDPEDVEPWTIASFNPLSVRGWERQRLQRHIRIQQRKGRFLGVRVEDLGSWDVWFSAEAAGGDLRDPADEAVPAAPPGDYGFEPVHYDLDVSIERRSMEMEVHARIEVEASSDGRRALTLEMHPDLVVRRVRDGAGRPLFFFRSDREIVVHLPEPSRAGSRSRIEIDYGGRGLRWAGRRHFNLVDSEAWYPHCGSLDRATYDVTFQWPRKLDLIAAGRLVDGGRRGAFRWERRRIDVPAIAFSFSLGDYHVEHHRAGEVDLRLAFLQGRDGLYPEEARERAARTLIDALAFYEKTFGPYPLDDLTVVVMPRRYSQSYLSYITMTDSIMETQVPVVSEWVRNTTIAHEVAHQWWGNLLGWWSYRDQWLGEAMANYSALLFHARTAGKDEDFLATMSAGWRNSLEKTLVNGRTLESFGPVVLGPRLNSSRSAFGYRAIVYRKGAVVLAMLARAIGEEQFLDMLRSLVGAASNRVLTTESFLEALERMSGRDLGGFARQYIYGTGIPDVYYSFEVRPGEPGGWVIDGEVRRLTRYDTDHAIVRDEQGRWDVLSRRRSVDDERRTDLMVPFRVALADESAAAAAGSSGRLRTSGKIREGEMLIRGGEDRFRIELDNRPARLELDPRGELLAHFLSDRDDPKRFARYQAEDLWREGDLDAAEAAYERALRLDTATDPENAELSLLYDPEIEARKENGRIQLALARIHLERGRDARARQALERVGQLFASDRTTMRMERDTLWARLEIRAGDHAAAHRRLKRTMRLAVPRRAAHNWRAQLWRVRLGAEFQATSAGFALLAVAAHETGHDDDFAWAMDEVRDRGVDAGPLADLQPL